MVDAGTAIGAIIVVAIPLGILVFFAYEAHVFIPSIARAYNYVPASMTVRHIDFAPQYCCHLVCFCDEVDNDKAEKCSALQDRSQALSPLQCSSSNSSTCPPTGAAAVCNNGPYCCPSCNYTCSLQSQNVCKCPCQQCSTCSCCKHVEGRLCRLFCDPCYKVNMMLDFKDRHGTPRSANLSHSAGQDLNDGQDFFNEHPANSSFLGFYKPSDPSIVHISRGYRVRKWAAFIMLSALPFFVIAVVITGFLTAFVLQLVGRESSFKVVFWANWVLWLGIIWPFLILLLILELAYPTPRAKTALYILIPLIACIGWLPAVPCCVKGCRT